MLHSHEQLTRLHSAASVAREDLHVCAEEVLCILANSVLQWSHQIGEVDEDSS